MADTSDFRNGLTIIWNGDLWTIVEFLHVKPGKGGAFVRTKLKNVRSGKPVDNTFRAGERIETARIERRPHQFLYEDDLGLHLMNLEPYEQFSLPASRAQGREFRTEGEAGDSRCHAEKYEPLTVGLPEQVNVTVVKTQPALRGDTAAGGSKPATVESGAVVNVPWFIEDGDV